MPTLQNAFDDMIDRLPRIAVEKIVREKLAECAIQDDGAVAEVVDNLLAGQFNFELTAYPGFSIEFTDEDTKRVESAWSAVSDTLPDLVENLAGRIAEGMASSTREQWHDGDDASAQREDLRRRILSTWKEPFDLTRMLVALCVQHGDEFNQKLLKSRRSAPPLKLQVLARLHIRACRIASEMILLLENGFTEGAQARWRTMHEVVVSATIIASGDDVLARRYVDYEAVERKKALDDLRRAPGEKPKLPSGLAAEIVAAHDRVLKNYGSSFRGMYGWAAGQCGISQQPQFYDLQRAAGSLSLKHRWRQATFDTHASPGTLSQPLHGWDPTTHVIGAFSPGFEEPATDLAQAIVQVTGVLFLEPWDLDQIATVKTMCILREQVADSWHRVAQRIERDDQRALERATRTRRGIPFRTRTTSR
jgi:hypothetical protein